jgi:hypothetical protein
MYSAGEKRAQLVRVEDPHLTTTAPLRRVAPI